MRNHMPDRTALSLKNFAPTTSGVRDGDRPRRRRGREDDGSGARPMVCHSVTSQLRKRRACAIPRGGHAPPANQLIHPYRGLRRHQHFEEVNGRRTFVSHGIKSDALTDSSRQANLTAGFRNWLEYVRLYVTVRPPPDYYSAHTPVTCSGLRTKRFADYFSLSVTVDSLACLNSSCKRKRISV